MKLIIGKKNLLFFLSFVFLCTSCYPFSYKGDILHYISRDQNETTDLVSVLLTDSGIPSLGRFSLVERISERLMRNFQERTLADILDAVVREYPDDMYNGFYRFQSAMIREKEKQGDAIFIYQEIVENYPDIIVNGESVQRKTLAALIRLTEDQGRKADYYRRFIDEFANETEYAELYYRLGIALEKDGQWDESIVAFAKYLNEPNKTIPHVPDAEVNTRNKIAIHESNRVWRTSAELSELIDVVQQAVLTGDPSAIRFCEANGFFGLGSNYNYLDAIPNRIFSVANYLGGNIRFQGLTSDSNDNEARLKSVGWPSFYANMPWYFYFKRIDYPANPDIHGRWEWKGVFFGDFL